MSKKMPLARNIIIISVIIIGLVGAFAWVNSYNPKTDEEDMQSTPNPQFSAYKIEQSDVDMFEIITNESTLTAKNIGDDKWSLNNIPYDELDASKISSLVSTVVTMISNSEVAKLPTNLSDYGLDTPFMTIKVTNKNGNIDKLLIGDKSPITDEYFFLVDGADTIYSIYSYKVDTILKPISYYQSFNRFNVDASAISEIIMQRKNNTIHLKIRDDIAEGNTYNVWQILEPYNKVYNSIDNYIDENILSAISSLSITDVAEAGKNYGLDNPKAILTLVITPYNDDGTKGEASQRVIKVGNSDNGISYVSIDNDPKIYTIDENSLNFLYTDEFLLVSKLQAMVDITNTDKVTISYNGKQSVLDISHLDEKNFDFSINGTPADQKLSKQMYQDIIALYVDGVYKNETLGSVDVVISYRGYNGNEDVTVELISINELSYALRKNGDIEFTIKKSKVNEMLGKLESFQANPVK